MKGETLSIIYLRSITRVSMVSASGDVLKLIARIPTP
jgi:hypothetical protein